MYVICMKGYDAVRVMSAHASVTKIHVVNGGVPSESGSSVVCFSNGKQVAFE